MIGYRRGRFPTLLGLEALDLVMKASLQSWKSLFQEMKEGVIECRNTYCMADGCL